MGYIRRDMTMGRETAEPEPCQCAARIARADAAGVGRKRCGGEVFSAQRHDVEFLNTAQAGVQELNSRLRAGSRSCCRDADTPTSTPTRGLEPSCVPYNGFLG
jgi:hypothetical protein